MRVSVITFPGSNCDIDSRDVFADLGHDSRTIWHKDTDLQNPDLVVLPGGFSYGDYLRSGALARFSPVMKEVISFAKQGVYILGICNGFQVLTEAQLLPGSLLANENLDFICRHQYIRVETGNSPWTHGLNKGRILDIPIAHKKGRYHLDQESLKRLEDNDQVIFRYADEEGRITPEANPNGSVNNIAGICSENRRILGMMPHPERAATKAVVSSDGYEILKAFESYLASGN